MKLLIKPPPVFRSMTATRFLLAVALDGPLLVKSLPAVLGIDKHHVFDLAARFERHGIVVLNPVRRRPRTVELDHTHLLYPELRALLFRLAATKPPRLRRAIVRGNGGVKPLSTFFGTRGRTLAIAWIARLGEVNVTDLRKLVRLRDQSIRVVLRYWQSLGFIRSRRLGGERVVSLDPKHPAAAQMQALLECLVEQLPDTRGLASWQRRVIERRKKLGQGTCPRTTADALPVGTPTQRELLALLAAHGDLPVSAIANTIGWTQDRVRGVLRSLVANGTVQTARVPGLRNGSLWVSVAHVPLERFLKKVIVGIAQPNLAPFQLPLVPPRFRKPRYRPQLLGPPLGRKVLIALASGIDAEDIEIADAVGSSARLVRRTLGRLAACGAVEWRPVGGRAKARINRRHGAFPEFAHYLAATGVRVSKIR